jgi:exopolysaccharide biosynthesis polyprenyl glycosylphosphotransferase
MALIDVLLMYAALSLSLVARKGRSLSFEYLWYHVVHFTPLFALWLVIFYILGFYRLDRTSTTYNYVKLFSAGFLASGFVSVCYFYINPVAYISPKLLLVLLFIIYGALLWGWRYLYEKRWVQNQKYRVGVGFIGITKEVEQIVRELNQHTLLGYDARFFFDPNSDELRAGSRANAVVDGGAGEDCPSEKGGEKIRRIGDVSAIRPIIQETNVDLVVIAAGRRSLSPELIRELYGLLDIKVRFMHLPDFYEMIFGRVPINAINEFWFLEHVDLRAAVPYETVKAIFDRILAALLLLISLPFFPIIALGIKLESKGPVFFKQERVGRNGRPFTMIKFRTMREEGNDFSPTEKGDGRITKFGSFLRSTRLDEIPQALNILRGEMSFIGPRPERPEIAQRLAEAIPYYQQRHLIKPGVTGWDQVCGEYHSPSIADTEKKLQYDLYYLKNISFSLDVSIFCRTILTMIRRKGR